MPLSCACAVSVCTEREGLDWLQAIDFQVASAKRLSAERMEEGYEVSGRAAHGCTGGATSVADLWWVSVCLCAQALASFLRDQRCRTTVKHSILRGMSKYTGSLDACLADTHDARPAALGHGSGSFDSGGLLCVQGAGGSDGGGSSFCPRPTDFMSSDSTSTLHVGIPGSDIPMPRLNIVIMLVGTRGDVQPFLYLARRLRDRGGHRVRVATHAGFRDMVQREGFLFYPLAGDPVKLSGYMVRSHGRIIPDLLDRRVRQAGGREEGNRPVTRSLFDVVAVLLRVQEMGEIPEKMLMLRDILQSTWPACTVGGWVAAPPPTRHDSRVSAGLPLSLGPSVSLPGP